VLPAHFSAVGMLMTDIRHDYVQTHARPLAEADFAAIRAICENFVEQGMTLLAAEGVAQADREVRLSMDIRYVGQEFYLNTPVSRDEIARADQETIRRNFDALHQRHYGQSAAHRPVEVVNVRASAIGKRAKMDFQPSAPASAPKAQGVRAAHLGTTSGLTNCAIYDRDSLPPGSLVRGPAIIEEHASTALLLAGDVAQVAPSGEIVISIGGT
jgi:N-methylhydantoinase A